jgi:hypothetical protein
MPGPDSPNPLTHAAREQTDTSITFDSTLHNEGSAPASRLVLRVTLLAIDVSFSSNADFARANESPDNPFRTSFIATTVRPGKFVSRGQTHYPSGLCRPLKVAFQFICGALLSIEKYARVCVIAAQVQVRGTSSWVIFLLACAGRLAKPNGGRHEISRGSEEETKVFFAEVLLRLASWRDGPPATGSRRSCSWPRPAARRGQVSPGKRLSGKGDL